VETLGKLFQLALEQALLEQLLLQPKGDRHAERAEAARRERNIGFHQPFEFQERLVVEHDVIELVEFRAGFLETIGDGVVWKRWLVFLAGEAFLLYRGHNAAVLYQRGCAIVVKGRDAKDTHRSPARTAYR